MPLNRRTFLRGAGGAALALPFLDAMSPLSATAAPVTGQKRFLTYFTPNGQEPQWWFEGGSTDENDFRGSALIAPLERHRSDLLIVRNLVNQAAIDGRDATGDSGHGSGMWSMLTGVMREGGSTSLDRLIARKHFDPTRHTAVAMDVSAVPMWPDLAAGISYDPSLIQPEFDPQATWDRFFKDLDVPEAVRNEENVARQSVLALVLEDYKRLRSKVGAADRTRLEQHLTEVESLESRLQNFRQAATCEALARPPALADSEEGYRFGYELVEELGKWNLDLAYHAFACDLTPVANVLWSRGGGDARYRSLGILDPHHWLTHPGIYNIPGSEEKRRQIVEWYASTLASFVTRLAETQDSGGDSLLENTMIYWTSEICEGDGHGQDGYTSVLLGSMGGNVRTGRCIDGSRRTHNELLSAIAVAFDVLPGAGRIGDYGAGPLAGVL